MPTSWTVIVSTTGGPIPVTVTRKRVKNLNLRVRPSGEVALSIPRRATAADAQAFLERRADWIAAHMARRREREQTGAARRFDPATGTVPLWGELVSCERALRDAGLRVPCKLDDLSDDEVDVLVEQLYRHAVASALPDAIARSEARVGAHAARWQVRRMRSRWGSCTPARKSIRISTALAAYPPACLEMVVAHELVHLIEPSHNARFHALLDTACPENRALTALLKRPPRVVATVCARSPRPRSQAAGRSAPKASQS